MPRNSIKEYLSFSKNDRIALIVITVVIGITMLIPYLIKKNKPATVLTPQLAIAVKQLDSLKNNHFSNLKTNEPRNYPYYADKDASHTYTPKGTLFNFDPNTLDEVGFEKLGLRPKTIGIIINYRNKGGKFKTPEDLQKIYGLHPNEFKRLLPYISISNREPQQEYVHDNNTANRPTYNKEKASGYSAPKLIDINKADTTAWITLPGIGSKLANRIVNFRDKLGGFHSIEQVAETYALTDSVFQKIKARLILESGITKININTADIELIKTHPYIRYKYAQQIIAYRNANGPYKSIDDLQKIMTLEQADYIKMRPYLTVE